MLAAKIINYLNTTHAGKRLLTNHTLDENGLWNVKGEDPNCDMGGFHHQPDLGVVEGTLQEALEYGLAHKKFFSWGAGGDIEKIKSISEIDSGYTIDSIFDHRMEPNYKLSIKYDGDRFTKKLEGTYLITKVEHILSVDTGSFSTKLEILDELKITQIKENSNMEKEIKIEI